MLLLKRLSDAHARGHRVLGLVRGSAVNSDGASNGLTRRTGPPATGHPRGPLVAADLTTADVDVVEGHGRARRSATPSSPGPSGDLRPGPCATAAARLAQVQHRPHPGSVRRRRGHQDDHGDAARDGTALAAPRTSPRPTSTGRRRRAAARAATPWPRTGRAAALACPPSGSAGPRARHPGTAPAPRFRTDSGIDSGPPADHVGRAAWVLSARSDAGTRGPGRAPARHPHGGRVAGRIGAGLGHHPRGAGAPCGRGRQRTGRPCSAARGARRREPSGAVVRGSAVRRRARVLFFRAGRAADRDGR